MQRDEEDSNGGRDHVKDHDDGTLDGPDDLVKDHDNGVTAARNTQTTHKRRPPHPRRGLSRKMTEWKRIASARGLPETSKKPTDFVIVYEESPGASVAADSSDEHGADDDEPTPSTSDQAVRSSNNLVVVSSDEHGACRSCSCCCCCRRKNDDEFAFNSQMARKKFRKYLEREGIEITAEHRNEEKKLVYMMLHTPFWRLCAEAERVCMKMPLKNKLAYDDEDNCCVEAIKRHLETDTEDDYVSGPFYVDRFHIYKDCEDADKFFRPALRSLLTHMILINIYGEAKQEKTELSSVGNESYLEKSDDEISSKKGLPYMLHNKYYLDAFTMHDQATRDPGREMMMDMMFGKQGDSSKQANMFPLEASVPEIDDTRGDLDRTWARSCRFQPLWKIRNYFGEKIGLYFAWCGILIITLWIPMLFGFAVFLYGLYLSATKRTSTNGHWGGNTTAVPASAYVAESISIVKESFDNDITPYYALVVTIWGTVFLEIWKRTNNTLAYEWDVNSFENTEPDRPEFVGNTYVKDPVTNNLIAEMTFSQRLLRFAVSISTLIFMVCMVFIVVASVIVYRVVLTVDYCSNMSPTECLIATTVGSSLLNAIAIVILGKIYDYLAVKLTDWENHRTQTGYNDSLIIKIFAFQFANSYSSLFYIAFFRGRAFQDGLFGLGSQYKDTCGDTGTTCMSMLSFQVLTLMLTKPLPKFLTDIVIPLAKWLWLVKIKKACCKSRKVGDEMQSTEDLKPPPIWEIEHNKPDTGDFTLSEYTEKVILYGFVMLFAASFSLAPLIAMLVLVIDIRVDAKRMLWLNRRSIAYIAQDIGTWYTILELLNIIGVITNACLIAFTSTWGQSFNSVVAQLLIVIGFEHIVFAIKFILAALIPDVPADIQLAVRRETYNNQLIRDDEKFNSGQLDTVREENEKSNKIKQRKSQPTSSSDH